MKGNVGRFWKLIVYPGWLPTMKKGPQFTTTRYWTVKTLNEAGSEFFSSAFSKEFSAINIIISALWNAKERTQTHLSGLLIFREYKKSVLFLAAKCVVNFYNSNRKLWQVFVCVSYHLEGMFIHKAIQKVSDSLGLGWVWETAFFFFFSCSWNQCPDDFTGPGIGTWKTTIVITVHGHACQEGSGDQEDVGYLCGDPRTSNNNTAVTTSITAIIISILSGWYLCFSNALKWFSMGKWNGIPKSFQFF